MKRLLTLLATFALGVALLAGCSVSTSTSKSLTYDVHDTGEKIVVELDTSTGLDLKLDGEHFTVTKDDEEVCSGTFITEDMRASYIESVAAETETDDVQLVDFSDEAVAWLTDGQAGIEYDHILAIIIDEDAGEYAATYALIGSLVEDTDAMDVVDDAIDLLTFTKQ